MDQAPRHKGTWKIFGSMGRKPIFGSMGKNSKSTKQALYETSTPRLLTKTDENALQHRLLYLPFKILKKIVSYAVGANHNLIHVKHTQAMTTTIHYASGQVLFRQRNTGRDKNKVHPLPPPGFRYAICVASQTEDAAYAEAQTMIHGIGRDHIRHLSCSCCGEWASAAVTEKFPFGLFTSCWLLNRLANSIFYTTNTFSFDDAESFHRFLVSLELRQKKMIKSLHLSKPPVDGICRDNSRWFKALEPSSIRRLESLRTVHFCLDMYLSNNDLPFAYSAINVKNLEDDLAPFLQLRVLPLTRVTVIISNDVTALTSEEIEDGGLNKRWTAAQKNEWAEKTRLELLETYHESTEVAVDPKEKAPKDMTITKRVKRILQQGWYEGLV